MSIISSLLGGGNILGALLNVASMIFPPAALASSLLSAFSGMMQNVIKGALEQLVKNLGLPKFLGDAISKLADQIFGGKAGGGAGADQQIQSKFGDMMKKLTESLTKDFVNDVKESMEENKAAGSSKGGWLVALAKAFGKIADKAAKDLETAGKNLNKENPSEMIEYQAKTQEFSQMMNTFINAIKTLGEAQSTAVRKG